MRRIRLVHSSWAHVWRTRALTGFSAAVTGEHDTSISILGSANKTRQTRTFLWFEQENQSSPVFLTVVCSSQEWLRAIPDSCGLPTASSEQAGTLLTSYLHPPPC